MHVKLRSKLGECQRHGMAGPSRSTSLGLVSLAPAGLDLLPY
jgi:hypothetical protein